MELPELPECPVCLQTFDPVSAIPRVLPCGHSTCESCLRQLPHPFQDTVRCPSCTQLVKFPKEPSSLPKNIDLLRLAALLQKPEKDDSTESIRDFSPQNDENKSNVFIPSLWSHEFYLQWRKWVFPNTIVLVEQESPGTDDQLVTVVSGKVVKVSKAENDSLMGFGLEGNEEVGLVKVGDFEVGNDNSSKFKYSYVAKVMMVLHKMRDEERRELTLILNAGLRGHGVAKALGFWYNQEDNRVYMIFERFCPGFADSLEELKKGFNEQTENEKLSNIFRFGMIGLGICQAVSALHLQGLVIGCLSMPFFTIDSLHRVYVDLSEVLTMGNRVHKMITEIVSGNGMIQSGCWELRLEGMVINDTLFVSPEIMFQLLTKQGVKLDWGSLKNEAGYPADVWSFACFVIWLLVGEPFSKVMDDYVQTFWHVVSDGRICNYKQVYEGWKKKVVKLLEGTLSAKLLYLEEILGNSLDFDPGSRPLLAEFWKCTLELLCIPDVLDASKQEVIPQKNGYCIVLGDLCRLTMKIDQKLKRLTDDLQDKNENMITDARQGDTLSVEKDVAEGLSSSQVKCIDLKGHLDCVTGLAVGGGFLFSSSFDKLIHVWSLQDFSHVHSFKGHEHKIMAVVYVDDAQPLCISGDNEGAICIWGGTIPFSDAPIRKLYEQKDWRYSGIHSLAVSGFEYLYTGSGDKSIKVWSLKDYNLSHILTGHTSVVSSLVVCNGVLYSGSWDGTIRLWSLSDQTCLTVLVDETPGNVSSVLSISAEGDMLLAAYENGCVKMWHNDVLLRTMQTHSGAVFSVCKKGKWVFTGGWDRMIYVQEVSTNQAQTCAVMIGSIDCDAVITAMIYWQGNLLVAQADKVIKVFYSGS